MDAKSFTLRMPLEVYARVAARKRKSVTEFVIEAVREKLDRELEEDIKRGFESLAADFEGRDQSPWMDAQREAMKHIDG